MASNVSPSMPGPPPLHLAIQYAACSVPSLHTCTYRPQKRCSGAALALRYILLHRSCRLMDAFVISSLPPVLKKNVPTVRRLRSPGITPLHRYYSPLRPPLAFRALPGTAGYSTYLPPAISRRGKTGFSSCSVCPCPRAVATTPPKWNGCVKQDSTAHAASALRLGARPSEYTLEATCAFTHVTARGLAASLAETLSVGFMNLVSRFHTTQATKL